MDYEQACERTTLNTCGLNTPTFVQTKPTSMHHCSPSTHRLHFLLLPAPLITSPPSPLTSFSHPILTPPSLLPSPPPSPPPHITLTRAFSTLWNDF